MYAVIMAGGTGGRLWPLSRRKKPKQFHALLSEKTIIRETYERLLPMFPVKEIFISTNPDFAKEVKKCLPEIPTKNYIIEPFQMGNAAACGLVSEFLYHRDPKSIAFFVPSDQHILNNKKYIETIRYGKKIAEEHSKHILTIGITPTKPDTGLGYIQKNKLIDDKAFSVKRFVEKPDLTTAQKYLDSGQYLWNSGMFIWHTEYILSLFKKYLPKTYKLLDEIGQNIGQKNYSIILNTLYKKVENTSIDFGIIEKTKRIFVIPADFGWSDVGSWGSLLEVLSSTKNVKLISSGHHVGIDSSECLIFAKEKLVATVGLKNIVVIDTPDAILICNSQESHKVKDLIEELKKQKKDKYL